MRNVACFFVFTSFSHFSQLQYEMCLFEVLMIFILNLQFVFKLRYEVFSFAFSMRMNIIINFSDMIRTSTYFNAEREI